ncbi:sensor histidine kinase [Aquimarina algicola]|nr:histidine kinase [Aquimarina algicola]
MPNFRNASVLNQIEKITEYIQSTKWTKHLIFWSIMVLGFMARDRMLDQYSLFSSLVRQLCLLVPQLIGAYLFAYYLIPRYILRKQKWFYISIGFMIIYFTSALGRILIIYISEPLLRTYPFVQEPLKEILLDWKKLLLNYFPSVYLAVFVFLFLKYFTHFANTKQKELTLKKEKVETELHILKAQLNPHFLFNTLNNIYVLAIENSPHTAYSIERLSEILDYILYRCSEKYVPLQGELRMLENYIGLEKLRYDDRLQVTFKKEIHKEIKIAPLILLSFVENAFKHGAGEDSGSPKIDITTSNQNGCFVFEICNTIQSIGISTPRKKIGLVNIRKQLELLYPNRYALEIENSKEDMFLVRLKIDITNED